jgi:hypothetical protein
MVKAGSLVTRSHTTTQNDSAWRRVRVSHPDFQMRTASQFSDCLSLSEDNDDAGKQ